MYSKIKNTWNSRPLRIILLLAIVVRIVAAVFSQGFGMHDDHYSIIEAAQSWVDGTDYNDWLPESQKEMKYRLTERSFDNLAEQALPEDVLKNLKGLKKRPFQSKQAFKKAVEEVIGVRNSLIYFDLIVKQSQLGAEPDGHSFFYVGIHYLFFSILKSVGIVDPQFKMFLVRLLHAFLSLLVVFYGFKITERLKDQETAKIVGLLLAISWFMPFLSVRNLNEVAGIPFLFVGLWLLTKPTDKELQSWAVLFGGFVVGLAFSVRFQNSIFIGGIGLAYLIQRKWKDAFYYGLGALLSMALIQGIVDLIIWERPFAELGEYIRYNLRHKNEYGANHPEMYFLVLTGIMVPPLGLFLFFGFLRTYKKILLIFLPTFLFLAFHTYFPNKQERFIFPIIPFFIMLGIIGWREFYQQSRFWNQRPKLLKSMFVFFWIVNFMLLPLFSTFYSKRARVESMLYLSKKDDASTILLENTNRTGVTFLPNYYSTKWLQMYKLPKYKTIDSLKFASHQRNTRHVKILYAYEYFQKNPKAAKPQYILFFGEKKLDERLEKAMKYFPNLQFDTKITPSFMDAILHKLNPANKNVPIFIYKTQIGNEKIKS